MPLRKQCPIQIAALTALLLAGCHSGHRHQDQKPDKARAVTSAANLPPAAKLVGSGIGKFDFHVPADGEIYVINTSQKKNLLYSGPFAAGQVIQLDPANTRLQFDGHTIEEPGLKITDHIEIYEDRD